MSGELSPGRVIRGLALGGDARFLAALAAAPAREFCRRHRLAGPSAVLGAEAMLANVLLSAHIEGAERILLEVGGRSPEFTYSGEVTAEGAIRARLTPALLPPVERLEGTLVAVKWDARRELYRGAAPLEHPDFQSALQDFLLRSQQTEGLVRLGCALSADGDLVYAAGLLVERLPEAPRGGVDFGALVDAPIPELIAGLRGALDGPRGELLGEPVAVLEVGPLFYRCRCSRERVERTLMALGADDLRDLLAEQGRAAVTCHFCNERYEVGPERLAQLIDRAG